MSRMAQHTVARNTDLNSTRWMILSSGLPGRATAGLRTDMTAMTPTMTVYSTSQSHDVEGAVDVEVAEWPARESPENLFESRPLVFFWSMSSSKSVPCFHVLGLLLATYRSHSRYSVRIKKIDYLFFWW